MLGRNFPIYPIYLKKAVKKMNILKFGAVPLAFLLLLGFCGCEKTVCETEKMTGDTGSESVALENAGSETKSIDTDNEVTYDEKWYFADMTEQIMADDEDWVLTGWNTPLYFGTYVGANKDGGGFNLVNKHELNDEKTYALEFELYTPKNENEEYNKPQNTLFVGLRVYFETGTAEENDGIWLGIKENTLAVKYSAGLDGLKQYTLPYSFTEKFRRVCIEDIQSENMVKVSVYSDNGEKTELYRLVFGSGKIDVYSYADGFAQICDCLETDSETYFGGYCRLWSNNRGGVYVKNVARTK